MIALRVHGQAAGEPDRDTGFIHPSFETLAHDRAAACRDALADEGVDAAARCIVTAQGDGDEQKVDFVPVRRPAARAPGLSRLATSKSRRSRACSTPCEVLMAL